MRKFFISLFLLLSLTVSYSQSYNEKLKSINLFLETFDNGYYGHLSIEDGVLYDHYKSGTFSNIPISDISEAKVVEDKRKVEIFCKNSTQCVTDYQGSKFDNMPFSTTYDFNASGFAEDLNSLASAYRTGKTPVSNSTAAFPKRSKVKVIKEDKPYNLLDALYDEENKNNMVIGIVIGDGLQPLGDGWYSGRLRLNDGTTKYYKKAQFVIVN